MSYPSAPEKPLRILQSLPAKGVMNYENCFLRDKNCRKQRLAFRQLLGKSGCIDPDRVWKVIQ